MQYVKRVVFAIPFGESAVSVARNFEKMTGLVVLSITITDKWIVEMVVTWAERPTCARCGKPLHVYGHGKCLKCFLETEEVK